MPTTYTHHRFGEDVFLHLPQRFQKQIIPYMNEFNLGMHGPDVLFYFHAYRKNKVNQYGVWVHDQPMKVFLDHAFSVFASQQDQDRAFAYLAGFLTHFYLDSTCHPYISKRIKETGISHTEIETELDAILMYHDELDPIRHKTAGHLRTDWKTAKIMAPYFDMKANVIWRSIFDMKLVLNHLFRSPLGVKRNAVILIDRYLPIDFDFEHYYVHKKRNKANKETVKHLLHIYASDIEGCAREIIALRAALKAHDQTYLEKELFQRTFS